MNWQSFIHLIQKESDNTIFLKNAADSSLIGKTISALLNTHGGKLIIGYDKVNVHLTGFDQPDQWIEQFLETNKPLYNFLLNKWYIDELYDLIFVNPIKKIGKILWKKGDQNLIDRFGPDGISNVIKFISSKAVQFQSGYIYDYAFVMLIGLSGLITYLILN